MDNKHVLVIEDEPTINRMISSYFTKAGYKVSSALDGLAGLEIFHNESIDLVCLDIMMPKLNGWHVAMKIRESSDAPIIMMSALSEEEDILKGYSLKVDDYITKPFNPKVLVAKAQNMLDRYKSTQSFTNNIITTNHLNVNLESFKIMLDDIELKLSKKEFELLHYFIINEGKVFSRNHLLDEIWGFDVYVEDRIVDTYIKKLRKHLGVYSDFIKTVFGVGYRFETYD